jgi:TonB-dependent receptor
MNNNPNYTLQIMRRFFHWGGFALGFLGLLISLQAQPTGSGTLTGTVTNAGTGATLAGAAVSLVGTNFNVLTQRDGTYTFSNVPAGNYKLSAFYTGLDIRETSVSVIAGEAVSVPIRLTADIYQLETFTVAGEREGTAASITRQRNAENLVNVISTDAYGDVADGNLGNFIQNLPSVSVLKQSGDLVGIGVRGTPPHLNSVMVDGTRFASAIAGSTAGMGDRTQMVDRIPAEFIKEITVTKANTPEQPADSLGGSVNLITKSAFDFDTRVITYRAGLTRNVSRDDFNDYGPTASFSYLNTFGPSRKIGVALSGSYSQTINTIESIWMGYPGLDERNNRARQLNDIAERNRMGLSGKLEYRFDSTMRISLGLSKNYYSFNDERVNWNAGAGGSSRIADYNRISRSQITAGTLPRDSAGLTAGVAPGFNRFFTEMLFPSLTNEAAYETRRSHQFKVSVDAEKTWADSRLTFNVSHNPSSFLNNFNGFSAVRTDAPIGISIDKTASHTRPVFAQTFGPNVGLGTDYSSWTATWFAQPDKTVEDVNDAKMDFEKKLNWNDVPVTLKAGLNYRHSERSIDTYRPTWNLVGADGFQGVRNGVNDDNIAQFLLPDSSSYSLYDNSMWKWNTFDYNKVKAHFTANPSQWAPRGTTVSTVPPTRIVEEAVSSAYVQGNFKFGALNVLTGVRGERTAVDAQGTYSDPLDPTVPVVRVSRSYQKIFPSIHFRYEPIRSFVVRASASTSSARPSISSLLPNTTVSYLSDGTGLGTVRQNNPGLKPNYTKTYDLSFEYYFEPAGLISAGVFRKDVTDFISSETRVIGAGAGNGFGGDFEGFNFVTSRNLGSAKIEGVELSYSQQFRDMPKPFNGLAAFANLTILSTQGQYANGATGLAQFVPRTLNVGLSYTWQKVVTRLTFREMSAYMTSYSANPASMGMVDRDPQFDLNLEYKWKPWATFFVDFVNLRNSTYDQYTISNDRITNTGRNGMRMNAGISGRF